MTDEEKEEKKIRDKGRDLGRIRADLGPVHAEHEGYIPRSRRPASDAAKGLVSGPPQSAKNQMQAGVLAKGY